jgi:hypothetical protein
MPFLLSHTLLQATQEYILVQKNQINELFYQLYDLTEEEVKIIENTTK